MESFYEQLMSRVSGTVKPGIHKPTKVKRKVWKFRPFITISREPGSGGRPIAKRLAKLTGFGYYNKELIEKIAKSAKQRKELIRSIDEKGRTWMQDFVHSLFNPDYVSDTRYIRYLSRVVLSLVEKGNVIILGRGSNFFTSGKRGLHVRVSAPYQVRVARGAKHEKISEDQAKRRVKKIDEDRKKFVSQYFGKNISNANYYDLVLNTTFMTIEDGAKLILKAFEHKFPRYLRAYKLRKKRMKKAK